MFIIALIYFLLFTILKYSSKQSIDNNEYSREISETTKIVYFRLLVSSVLVIISCLMPTSFIVPELPLAILAVLTLIPSDSYGKKYS